MPNYDDLFSSQPGPQEDGSFDKEAWAAKKQAERDQVYGLIDAYVHDMSNLGKLTYDHAFQTYLDVQARFDRYSVSNAVLIAAQYQEATRLSYMLCKCNGMPVESFSFEPMPEEYGMMEPKEIRAELGVMRDVAGTITADMNRLFAAQEKAQKNRDAGTR